MSENSAVVAGVGPSTTGGCVNERAAWPWEV